MIRVTENLRKIQDLLAKAAADAGRSDERITLLAVSKKKPLQSIQDAAAAGQRDFGENFAQEGVAKVTAMASGELVWHFIGALQGNKTRMVAEHFQWVHTVDREKIARRLSAQRPPGLGPLQVCIEVNVDDEDNKSGVPADKLLSLARTISELPNMKLRGLMCLPRMRDDFAAQREPFAHLRQLKESLVADGLELDTLSMGMSADYAAAVYEGATIVRIGTALFGKRA